MRALGIVCEYNPFHLGHLYHMKQSGIISGDDLTVCVMSGDFVQRGEAAMMSKFARAEAACRSGADLVLELPLPWCLSSAETFARGAVSILAAVGCSTLSFGSETDRLCDLEELANTLLEDNTGAKILNLMKADPSLSYAKARTMVLESLLGEKADLLNRPNNILAVEYLKTILRDYPTLKPLAVLRRGAGHDRPEKDAFPSAKALREMCLSGDDIKPYLPTESAEIFTREADAERIFRPDVMEGLLRSRLYQMKPEDFELLPDAGVGAGRRLCNMIKEGRSLQDTVDLASTKRYAKSRIRRMLLCASLGIYASDSASLPPYARILACSGKGREYLKEEKSRIHLPILTKPAAVKKMGTAEQTVFSLGASAHDLYLLQYNPSGGIPLGEDWKTGPVLV